MGHSSNQEIASSSSLATLTKAKVTLLQFNDTLAKETKWKLSQIILMSLQEKGAIVALQKRSAAKINRSAAKDTCDI